MPKATAGISPKSSRARTRELERTTPEASRLDALHDRIQSRLNELHADFKQLATDVGAANQASSRARKGRIAGFKRALRDILQAADRAQREWK